MKLMSLVSITGMAIAGVVASGFLNSAQAIGTLLTSEVGYTGLGLDLAAYKTGDNNYTNGPVPIPGGITFTSTVPGGSTLGQNPSGFTYELGSNGRISDVPVFAGLDQNTAGSFFMAFNFETAVQQFGAFLNYAPNAQLGFGAPTIETFDSSGNLLSTFNLEATPGGQISTPGQTDAFAFRGIAEDSAIISSFRLSGGNLVATGATPTAVPEPVTIIGTIIGGTAAFKLRKKFKAIGS